MSADRSAELAWAGPVLQVLMAAAVLAERAGAVDVAFGHEILGRMLLVREERPRLDDRVQWFLTARRVVKIAGQRPLTLSATGTHTVDATGDHVLACGLAAVEFLDKLGIGVTLDQLGVER